MPASIALEPIRSEYMKVEETSQGSEWVELAGQETMPISTRHVRKLVVVTWAIGKIAA
jgi:hypothetical protein